MQCHANLQSRGNIQFRRDQQHGRQGGHRRPASVSQRRCRGIQSAVVEPDGRLVAATGGGGSRRTSSVSRSERAACRHRPWSSRCGGRPCVSSPPVGRAGLLEPGSRHARLHRRHRRVSTHSAQPLPRSGRVRRKRFPVAYNDVDYGFRLADAGFRSVYCAEAVLHHHEGLSRGRTDDPRDLAVFRAAHGRRVDPYFSPHLDPELEIFEPDRRSSRLHRATDLSRSWQ